MIPKPLCLHNATFRERALKLLYKQLIFPSPTWCYFMRLDNFTPPPPTFKGIFSKLIHSKTSRTPWVHRILHCCPRGVGTYQVKPSVKASTAVPTNSCSTGGSNIMCISTRWKKNQCSHCLLCKQWAIPR